MPPPYVIGQTIIFFPVVSIFFFVSLDRLKLEASDFVHRYDMSSASPREGLLEVIGSHIYCKTVTIAESLKMETLLLQIINRTRCMA